MFLHLSVLAQAVSLLTGPWSFPGGYSLVLSLVLSKVLSQVLSVGRGYSCSPKGMGTTSPPTYPQGQEYHSLNRRASIATQRRYTSCGNVGGLSFWEMHLGQQISKSALLSNTLEFSLNAFTEFAEFSDKKKIKIKKEDSRVGTQDLLCKRQRLYHSATSHKQQSRSLCWTQFMPQWFLRFSEFPEFTEFNESFAPFRENSIAVIWVNAKASV